MRLWHGGVPDLRPGDLIEPGHERKAHDGCPWCEARANGLGNIDGPSGHADRVYLTTDALYAKYHASLWGRGDVYPAEPIGRIERSTEDSIETWTAEAARVVKAPHRAVLLTNTERRRLWREWGAADKPKGYGHDREARARNGHHVRAVDARVRHRTCLPRTRRR